MNRDHHRSLHTDMHSSTDIQHTLPNTDPDLEDLVDDRTMVGHSPTSSPGHRMISLNRLKGNSIIISSS